MGLQDIQIPNLERDLGRYDSFHLSIGHRQTAFLAEGIYSGTL